MNSPFSRRDWMRVLGLGSLASGTSCKHLVSGKAGAGGERARGIVFMVSDGMSPGVFTMAQYFSNQLRRKDSAWWNWYHEPGTARGLMDTASANSPVTDSSAASSAWGGGRRVNNGSLNVAPDGSRVVPIAALLKKWDPDSLVGLVTTATVTHATPAGFAAQAVHRDLEDLIAPQYLNRVDLILGGGSKFFDPDTREDRRDLVGEFRVAGYETIRHRDELLGSKSDRVLGTFANKHLPFSLDRDHIDSLRQEVPTLEEMSEFALDRCLKSGRRFLLQIEGARVDHAAHMNDAAGLLHDQLAFDDALGRVLEMTAPHSDVLVVATSDHGNANPGLRGMGEEYLQSDECFARLLGCKASYESLFEQWRSVDQQSVDVWTQMVRDHMGIELARTEVEAILRSFEADVVVEWNHQLATPHGILGQVLGNHTGISWNGSNHTSDPTLVTARGVGAERFEGIVRNTDVFTHLCALLG